MVLAVEEWRHSSNWIYWVGCLVPSYIAIGCPLDVVVNHTVKPSDSCLQTKYSPLTLTIHTKQHTMQRWRPLAYLTLLLGIITLQHWEYPSLLPTIYIKNPWHGKQILLLMWGHEKEGEKLHQSYLNSHSSEILNNLASSSRHLYGAGGMNKQVV